LFLQGQFLLSDKDHSRGRKSIASHRSNEMNSREDLCQFIIEIQIVTEP
jgi:hypothetical protein